MVYLNVTPPTTNPNPSPVCVGGASWTAFQTPVITLQTNQSCTDPLPSHDSAGQSHCSPHYLPNTLPCVFHLLLPPSAQHQATHCFPLHGIKHLPSIKPKVNAAVRFCSPTIMMEYTRFQINPASHSQATSNLQNINRFALCKRSRTSSGQFLMWKYSGREMD